MLSAKAANQQTLRLGRTAARAHNINRSAARVEDDEMRAGPVQPVAGGRHGTVVDRRLGLGDEANRIAALRRDELCVDARLPQHLLLRQLPATRRRDDAAQRGQRGVNRTAHAPRCQGQLTTTCSVPASAAPPPRCAGVRRYMRPVCRIMSSHCGDKRSARPLTTQRMMYARKALQTCSGVTPSGRGSRSSWSVLSLESPARMTCRCAGLRCSCATPRA